MITASGNYVLYEGSKLLYSELVLVVDYAYSNANQAFLCTITPATITAAGTSILGSYTRLATKAEVDAKAGTGTNPSDKLQNQIDQVTADYLDAITENSALTFTVS